MYSRNGVGLLLFLLAVTGLAQDDRRLPGTLSGRWTLVAPTGVIIEVFSITFEGNGAPGSVTGRLTWRGVNCGAKDEPIHGSWDGMELKFEAFLKANANTQHMNGNCPTEPARWILRRKVGERSFEGEARVANIVVTMSASP